MTDFWRDIRFGARILRRSPSFALTVALLLGVGIGANTLVFSLLYTLLLRPLPVKHPEQLVRLIEIHPTGFETWDFPHDLCDELASSSSSLTDVLCQGDFDVAFEAGGAAERIRVNAVSKSFFETLAIQARYGRVLLPEEDKPGVTNAVVSYDFWRTRLSGSTAAIGRDIRLNGRPFTVVGVLPRGINGLTVDTSPDVRVPFSASPLLIPQVGTGSMNALLTNFQIFARLRPGVALARAQAEIEPLLHARYDDALIRAFPELAQGPRKNIFDSRLSLEPTGNGVSALRAQFSEGLVLLMACVGLLLCMACANVAGLVLARSSARSQEISIRLALGAGVWRIARQLLSESVILAAAGGAIGLLITYAGAPVLVRSLPPVRDRAAVLQPVAVHLDIDTRVLAFAALVSLLSAALFGLLPAIRGARGDVAASLRPSRTTTSPLSTRNTLLVAQIAICVLLLAGSSLLVRNFSRMQSMDAGFDRDHVATFTFDPSLTGYNADRARVFSKLLLEKTRALPRVVAAGLASRGVMRGTGIKSTFGVAGAPIGRNEFLNTSLNTVTPGYFDAMGMRIVAGRDFNWSDTGTEKPQKG